MFAYDVKKNGTDVDVTLTGRLDGAVAPQLHEQMVALQGQDIKNITFHVKDLEYISSAGLRVILFAKQKLGADTRLYLKDVGEGVRSVLEVTGFDNFVEMI
ncbi:MAG: STAS domain-containing protein [Oscillibacter sp.]|nr:STAS domain-containing protein [Oscillibacter sp.]